MRAKLLLLAAAMSTIAAGPSPRAAEPPVVAIDSGQVRGTIEGGVEAFKGIPYAAPPVGEFRWRLHSPHAAGAGFATQPNSVMTACRPARRASMKEPSRRKTAWS